MNGIKLSILLVVMGMTLGINAQTFSVRAGNNGKYEPIEKVQKQNFSPQEHLRRSGNFLMNAAYLQAGTIVLGGLAAVVGCSNIEDANKIGAWIIGAGALTCQVFSICQFVKAGKELKLSAGPGGATLSYRF